MWLPDIFAEIAGPLQLWKFGDLWKTRLARLGHYRDLDSEGVFETDSLSTLPAVLVSTGTLGIPR